jgi:hypothetical protein
MKTTVVWAGMMVLGLFLIPGCDSGQKAAPAAVELQNAGTLDVYSVNFEQRDGKTVVSGLIRQTGVAPATAGHVDIEVVKSDGSVVYQTRSETMTIPRNAIGRGMKHKSFQVPLNVAKIDPADHIILKGCSDSQCQIKPI